MFHMCFRRRFRNELCTKIAGSPEMLRINKGREFDASSFLGIGRYFDRHPNLDTQTDGELISSKIIREISSSFCPCCVL